MTRRRSGKSVTVPGNVPGNVPKRGTLDGSGTVRGTGEVGATRTEPVVILTRNGIATRTKCGGGRRRRVVRDSLRIPNIGITEIEDVTGVGHHKLGVYNA